MNALPVLADLASWFCERLARSGASIHEIPAAVEAIPGVCWSNAVLASPRFRYGHVEHLSVPGRLAVLHVCLFPRLDDARPIFGFDMVAGPARVTGIFLDFTPVLAAPPLPSLGSVIETGAQAGFSERRTLPAWADFFSPDMLAIRPADMSEVERAARLAQCALEVWLATAPHMGWRTDDIAAGQARYVAAQRRNERTRQMLSRLIGAEPARRFIDEVLFPSVPATRESSCAVIPR